MESRNMVVGVDVGGSHVTAALVDVNSRCLIGGTAVRKAVDSKGSAEEILSVWKAIIKDVLIIGETNAKRIAFAMPGPFDYENGISLIKGVDKYESLYGMDIRKKIAGYFDIPFGQILFRNDAEAFLHGEVAVGNFNIADKILGFTLGTGFGSAYSYQGDTREMGIGLLPFKESIFDDYLTTRWFRNTYGSKTGQFINVQQISQLAQDGNKIALALFDEFAVNLAEVLCKQLKEKDAVHVILGGNISKAYELFLPHTQYQLDKEGIFPQFSLAKLGEQSAIVGSAYLFAPLFDMI